MKAVCIVAALDIGCSGMSKNTKEIREIHKTFCLICPYVCPPQSSAALRM